MSAVLQTTCFNSDPVINKHDSHQGLNVHTFTIDDTTMRVRYRPAWSYNGVYASLMVFWEGAMWECVRYVERRAVKYLGADWLDRYLEQSHGDPAIKGLDADGVRAHFQGVNDRATCFKSPHQDAPDMGIETNSFWSRVTHGDLRATTLRCEALKPVNKDRATVELYCAAVPTDPTRLFETHYSLRLELLRIE